MRIVTKQNIHNMTSWPQNVSASSCAEIKGVQDHWMPYLVNVFRGSSLTWAICSRRLLRLPIPSLSYCWTVGLCWPLRRIEDIATWTEAFSVYCLIMISFLLLLERALLHIPRPQELLLLKVGQLWLFPLLCQPFCPRTPRMHCPLPTWRPRRPRIVFHLRPRCPRPTFRPRLRSPCWTSPSLSVLASLPFPRKQYKLLILRTYRQFSGKVWLAYDRAFREHAAAANVVDWSSINVQLFNFHAVGASARGPNVSSPDSSEPAGASTSQILCKSWNRGRCVAPYASCRYAHRCYSCSGAHRAIHCPGSEPAQPPVKSSRRSRSPSRSSSKSRRTWTLLF